MKSIILLIAGSLMLVGALIAVAVPSPIQAAPPHQWCYTENAGIPHCFANKGECKKSAGPGVGNLDECHKVTGPI